MLNNKHIELTVAGVKINVIAEYCDDTIYGENYKGTDLIKLAYFETSTGYQKKENEESFKDIFGGNVAGVFDRTTGEIIPMFSRKEHGGGFFNEALRDFDRRTH